jgi:hypothetical protein
MLPSPVAPWAMLTGTCQHGTRLSTFVPDPSRVSAIRWHRETRPDRPHRLAVALASCQPAMSSWPAADPVPSGLARQATACSARVDGPFGVVAMFCWGMFELVLRIQPAPLTWKPGGRLAGSRQLAPALFRRPSGGIGGTGTGLAAVPGEADVLTVGDVVTNGWSVIGGLSPCWLPR